jgi:hypothetical protein
MKFKTFKTTEQLSESMLASGMSSHVAKLVESQLTIEQAVNNLPNKYALSMLLHGYEQFHVKPVFEKLHILEWAVFVTVFRDLAEFCPWGEFSLEDWTYILPRQPGFVKYCVRSNQLDDDDILALCEVPGVTERVTTALLEGLAGKSPIEFDSMRELHMMARADSAPDMVMEDLESIVSVSDLDTTNDISFATRLWCLARGYDQLWQVSTEEDLTPFSSACLITAVPEYINRVDTGKLGVDEWLMIVAAHPDMVRHASQPAMVSSRMNELAEMHSGVRKAVDAQR